MASPTPGTPLSAATAATAPTLSGSVPVPPAAAAASVTSSVGLSSASVQSNNATSTFTFPARYNFPPMWTLQPTLSTREEQFKWWSALIQSYSAHHRLFRLSIADALESPLFRNAQLNKRMTAAEAVALLDWMCGSAGGRRAEWIGRDGDKASAWIYWRRPEEWGELVAKWVDDMGLKGTVLTVFELVEGEGSAGQDFHGMDTELMLKSLQVLAKRGKAQIFGSEDEQGVKIF